MTRSEIITALKEFFDIEELVCPHCYAANKDRSWQFLDTELLHTLLIVRRDIIQEWMTINNYKWGGIYHESGLRCNICDIVKEKSKANTCYLSAHVNGAGVDARAKTLTAEACRQSIIKHQDLLPYPIRLEKDVTWLHLDIYDYYNGLKVNLF